MEEAKKEWVLDELFYVGMRWRIVYGLVRFVFGLALLRMVGTTVSTLLGPAMTHEFSEDPHDILYRFVAHTLTRHPIEITYFIALYFVVWGLADAVLSLAVIHKKPYAYVASMMLISVFTIYEAWRYLHTHSLILLGIIVLDIGLIVLIQHEYKKLVVPQTSPPA